MFEKRRTIDTKAVVGTRPAGVSKRDWSGRRVEIVTDEGEMIWAGPAGELPRKLVLRCRRGRWVK